MNYEEIGKQAVKDGYDGGGIWAVLSPARKIARLWKNDPLCCEPLWPDFSYPETKGAALAWIAEKARFECAVYHVARNEFQILGIRHGRNDEPWLTLSGSFSTRVECILHAIKSLNLGKKDNSPMGLNKKLLAVGFRTGGCEWMIDGVFGFPTNYDIELAIRRGFETLPHGHHPSTIGVATAWIRSFEKIGDTLHFWYNSQTGTWSIGGQTLYPTHDGFSSELEALVEFAEWAKEEGLLT